MRGDAQQLFIGNVSQDGELEANKAISQTFIQATDDEKERRLFDILNDLEEKKAAADDKVPADYNAIVFANTKNRVDRLTRVFWDWEFGTCAVHGGKRQDERDKALAKFVSKECPVMFATDVAARGLDIKGVTHVINFDMARDVESYVHRVGRTGRAGELGDGARKMIFRSKIHNTLKRSSTQASAAKRTGTGTGTGGRCMWSG